MSASREGIRRLANGSIDFGFYRRRAAWLRLQAMRELFVSTVRPLVRPAIAVAVIAAALYAMPGKTGHGWNGPRDGGGLTAVLPAMY